ncbi:hypothetical protein ACEK07_46020 [Alcanivoracaceae bacterium MT1]
MKPIHQREHVRRCLYKLGGATRNEIAEHTGILVQTLCLRLRELEVMGHIVRFTNRECTCTHRLNIEYRLSGQMRGAMTRRAA